MTGTNDGQPLLLEVVEHVSSYLTTSDLENLVQSSLRIWWTSETVLTARNKNPECWDCDNAVTVYGDDGRGSIYFRTCRCVPQMELWRGNGK